MILLLYAVLSCAPFVRASLPSLNDTSIHTLDSSTCSPCNTRTLWDILWSCGLTLFACTWTAVHPNIPGVDDGVVRNFFLRLGLMVMTLFAPEFTITWAAVQFLSARQAVKELNEAIDAPCAHDRQADSELAVILPGDIPYSSRSSSARWTLIHGFFASMGGFVLYVDGEPWAALRPVDLLHCLREGSVDMPTITEAEIKDRSKGDGISKCVALLQLVWFVAQLIARYVQGLPVTLIEIDTLGVVTLTCIVYGFWWKKPKDIGLPYIVHWKPEVPVPPGLLARHEYRPGKRRSYMSPYANIDDNIDDGPTRSFILTAGCVSGMMFGAIHCLGWNYLFQAHNEQVYWRLASIGMACSPLMLIFPFCMVIIEYLGFACVAWTLILIIPFAYIASRITIIVLMCLSLRSLPPGAYDTVAWTEFIPHINL